MPLDRVYGKRRSSNRRERSNYLQAVAVDLRAAYDFLRIVAFHDMPLPERIELRRRRTKFWGTFWDVPPEIAISHKARRGDLVLRIMAHEMIHAVQHSGCGDLSDHGPAFKTIESIVCERMGWETLGI
jgi:hypothetical protein